MDRNKSRTLGVTEKSVKKLKMTGSSSPSAFCGGVSMQVPYIHRTNNFVLSEKEDLVRIQLKRTLNNTELDLNRTTHQKMMRSW